MTLDRLKQEIDNLGVTYRTVGRDTLRLSHYDNNGTNWEILEFDLQSVIGANTYNDVRLTIPAANHETAILKDVLPLVVQYLETPLIERKNDKVRIKVTGVRFGDDNDVFSLKRPKYVFVQDNGDIVLGEREESKFKKSDVKFLMKTKFSNAVYELIPAGDEN